MFEGCQPSTVELLEYYEDNPSGRIHLSPEHPPTRPGLGFDTPEDRDRARELLLRIEDFEYEGKLKQMHKDAPYGSASVLRGHLLELLELLDTIRSE